MTLMAARAAHTEATSKRIPARQGIYLGNIDINTHDGDDAYA
jgi:hypothetical protein